MLAVLVVDAQYLRRAESRLDVRVLVWMELLAEVFVRFLDFAVGGTLLEAEKL
jgi:hypothetical protein